MSKIADLLELPKIGTCWGNCGKHTKRWFAIGHDSSFQMALLEHMVTNRFYNNLRDIRRRYREWPASQSLPPHPDGPKLPDTLTSHTLLPILTDTGEPRCRWRPRRA